MFFPRLKKYLFFAEAPIFNNNNTRNQLEDQMN